MNFSEAIKLLATEQGLKIFPCAIDKKPACLSWKEAATCNQSELLSLANHREDDLLAGIKTGIENDLLVIDIDINSDKTKDGVSEFHNFLKDNDITLPNTWRTRTQNSGFHIYFKYPPNCGLTAHVNTPCKDVDIRGEGAYVIAYNFVEGYSPQDTSIAHIPDKLLKLLTEHVKKPDKKASSGEFDNEGNMIDGREAFKSKLIYKELVEFINIHSRKPVESEVLEMTNKIHSIFEKVCGAHKYDLSDRSIDETAYKVKKTIENNTIEDILRKQRDVKLLPFTSLVDVQIKTNPNYLIKGLMEKNSFSVVYGSPAAGKSFFMIDAALHIARGIPFHNGLKVKQGNVLYCTLEAPEGFMRRLYAAQIEYGIEEEDIPFFISKSSFSLSEGNGTDEVIELIESIKDLKERSIDLVIIDTLARAIVPANENDAVDMGKLVRNCEKIMSTCGTSLCLVHHCGKDKKQGARGSNSLLGAVDTEIFVEKKEECDVREVIVTKQKDAEPAPPFYFTLDQVTLGLDEDGDEITSCVIKQSSEPVIKKPLSAQLKLALEALQEELITSGKMIAPKSGMALQNCVTYNSWLEIMVIYGVINTLQDKAAANKIKLGLLSSGAIGFYNDMVWINK